MADYYAVQRSDDFLAHYGVKGMRWGVRKAIESGDQARLSKHFQKASKKLAKLSLNANREVQQKRYDTAKRNMVKGGLVSGGLSAAGTYAVNSHLPFAVRARVAGLAGLGGLAAGHLFNNRGIMSVRYISDRGHARAVEKRNRFAKEMNEAFKNSAYGGSKMRAHTNQLMALSNVSDPKSYIQKQANKANRSAADSRKTQQALQNWGNAFEKHYQAGLKKGMTHEQAERYSNDYIAKHGFKPVNGRRRRK